MRDQNETNQTQSRLLTLKAAARFLSRSVDSLRRLIYAGQIPVVRSPLRGSKEWIDRGDLEQWIRENKRSYNTPPRKDN